MFYKNTFPSREEEKRRKTQQERPSDILNNYGEFSCVFRIDHKKICSLLYKISKKVLAQDEILAM